MNNSSFVNTIRSLIFIFGSALYLYAIVAVGLASVNTPNDQGRPVIPDEQMLIITVVGTILAVNFGAVLGIDMNQPGPHAADSLGSRLGQAIAAILQRVRQFSGPQVAVLLYLLGLALAFIFFAADGGLSGESASIAEPLVTMWQTIIGVIGGVFATITQR